jgi:hypothetical protein
MYYLNDDCHYKKVRSLTGQVTTLTGQLEEAEGREDKLEAEIGTRIHIISSQHDHDNNNKAYGV